MPEPPARLPFRWLVPAALLLIASCRHSSPPERVGFPGGDSGIGFDDLRYSPALHRLLVPAGRTGMLHLIDPDTLAVRSIGGFGATADYSGGHDDGPTSVDVGDGVLYVTDRTTQKLDVVDVAAGRIVASAALGGGPDYVRFVPATREVWVTEPDAEQIEIFAAGPEPTAAPTRAAVIAVHNGPESLVIDNKRGRAYAHRWEATTVVIGIDQRAIVAEWPNGCTASRGIALDEERGGLFVACSEGKVSVLDVTHDGRILSTMTHGEGFDVVGYAPKLGHLYLAGGKCACFVTLGVSRKGQLRLLGEVPASRSTHCAVADDAGHGWWCDPDAGKLWRVTDTSPPSL